MGQGGSKQEQPDVKSPEEGAHRVMNSTMEVKEEWKHVEAAIVGVQTCRPSPMNFEQLNGVSFRLVSSFGRAAFHV